MKEIYFLDYNKDNIFSNLIQAEDHLKKVTHPGFSQCVLKHLIFAEAEADEAIAHSMVAEPDKTNLFKELRNSLSSLRKTIQTGIFDPDEAIIETRKIRRKFENFNKEFDISKCNACGTSKSILGNLFGTREKYLKEDNTNNNIDSLRGENMDKKQLGYIVGSQAIGRAVQEGVSAINQPIVTGVTVKNIVGIVGGLALSLASLVDRKVPDGAKLPMAVIGSKLLVDEIADISKGYIPTGAAFIPSVTSATIIRRPVATTELVKVD